MIKHLSKVAAIGITLTVLFIAGLTTIPVFAQSKQLPDGPCQCVKYATNSLFGFDQNGNGNVVTVGTWDSAQSMGTQTYWDNAFAEYPQTGLYKQVNPAAPLPADVIIMKSNALVYVKRTDGVWDKLTYIGSGNGHIGFVSTAFYYDKDAEKVNPDFTGMSGWLITMQSANWGTAYIPATGLTDMTVPNLYGSYLPLKNGCTNVNNSTVFLPTDNPVSFWRRQ